MKHGEQLAPLHRARCSTRPGSSRQDLTAIAVGVGPGPVHRPAGRPGHRAHARASSSRSRCTACARSTCSRVEAVDTGRRWHGDFVVATDARRKEVYLASYDADGRRLARARWSTSPATSPPTCRSWARAPCSTPTRSRTPSARPGRAPAGWPGVVTEERAELLDPEPLYLRRPDAVAPAQAQAASRDPRRRRPADVAAVAALEADNLGADAWSRGPGRARASRGRLPTVRYLVAEVDGAVVGHAVASVAADIAELQRIAVDRGPPAYRPRHRPARRGRASCAATAAPTGCCSRSARTTRGALAFYERRASPRSPAAARYYRDGATAVVLSLGLERRDGAVGG